MNVKQKDAHASSMTLGDILYVLFRHKWKITLLSLCTLTGTFCLMKLTPKQYQSEAKLYIRYVLETKSPSQAGENLIKSPDRGGDWIINTELEILTSLDLAKEVAAVVGPERILGPGASREQAAMAIQGGLTAEPVLKSSVILLTFKNQKPDVVQPVLHSLIEAYFKKHTESHALGAFDEFLTQETDQLRSRLEQTEGELRKEKNKAGVISMADSRKAYTDQISRVRQGLFEAEAELAERQAVANAMAKFAAPRPGGVTNTVAPPSEAAVTYEKAAEYKRVCGVLETLVKREQDQLVTFTPESALVKEIREQIAFNQKRKQELEQECPGLIAIRVAEPKGPGAEPAFTPANDLATETARISALETKIRVFTNQLEHLTKEASSLDDAEVAINDLQRKVEIEQNDFIRFSANLRQSRIDEKLGAGRVSNISTIQEATPPAPAPSKLYKLLGIVLAGGIAVAFGLPFLIEFYLDQTIRRSAEVESKLGLPLFINIPLLAKNGHSGMLSGSQPPLLAERNEGEIGTKSEDSKTVAGLEVTLGEHAHPLRKYYEALRDRLITYCEMKNLIHKPKLVAVTSCAEGSGVSTTAAGLAAALSETGDGNVLLVNMNVENGAAHRFHKGELACGLEQALQTDKREGALVQENLYVVNEGTAQDQLSPILPKQFKHLVPRLKASDFDYIIFDMPPVSQISLTPRLARFMDVVLMVVESEKTGREIVKKATALLAETNANLGVVLNKGRKYVPDWLKQDI